MSTLTADTNTGTSSPTYAGTLRYDLTNYVSGDTITFASSLNGNTITVGSTLPTIGTGKNVTIIGNGPANTIISGGNNGIRIFRFNLNETSSMSNLTVEDTGLYTVLGAAIDNATGTLTLTNVTVSGNSCTASGAGIANAGLLTLSDCTISGNSSGAKGGAIYNSGGTITASNCTFSGNTANSGGGIDIFSNDVPVTLSNDTLYGNSAAERRRHLHEHRHFNAAEHHRGRRHGGRQHRRLRLGHQF